MNIIDTVRDSSGHVEITEEDGYITFADLRVERSGMVGIPYGLGRHTI